MESYLLLVLVFTTTVALYPDVNCSEIGSKIENEHLANHSSRVIGGEPAEPGKLPYQLSLQYRGRHFCGAVLIKSNTIPAGSVALTAAHCVDGKQSSLSSLTVMGGSILLQDNPENSTRQVLGVEKFIIHEGFDMPKNDIAIIFLSEKFSQNKYLRAISLPLQNELFEQNLLVSGWGKTSVNPSTYTNALHFTSVPVLTNEKCAELYAAAYGNRQVIFDFNICAGNDEGGQDTCQGDSGGPGINPAQTILHGLTSWGLGCAEPGFPGVYTRVSYFVDWVIDNVAAELNQ